MTDILRILQRLYESAVASLDNMRSASTSGLLLLIVAAFAFGMLHALLPGHGKSVLASYYAGDGRLMGALGSSGVMIATHVGLAVLLVLSGFALLEHTIGRAGRSALMETASQLLIALIGLWLLTRAFRPHTHDQDRSGPALAFVAGLVPCPLTTFIMTYAISHGVIAAGLVLSGAFALGMVVTVAAFPILAILLRLRLHPILARAEWWRQKGSHWLEIGAAFAVFALGLWPLLR